MKQGGSRDLIQPESIKEKHLFFEEKFTEQLSLLESSLKVDQLDQLQQRLDGILIATTNLIKNFDGAFARRFLFKVPFDKPTVEAKKSIWKDKLSWLGDKDTAMLAQRHDLSGGEIDNVVRKSLMEEVIKGRRPTVEMLSRWSSQEKFGNEKGQAIGFSA